ncbi:MAG TPA: T9SS type A sorting domain-containing protein [Bacteroidetes bacterium]|nr:T9SS type A sorting domain-containing protein [Bacteroidota bacterium]
MKLPIKYITAILVLMISGTCLTAQITVNQDDMPSTGDTVRKRMALNFENYDFESAGPDFTWDFSGLIPLSQTVDTFLSVTETPVFYWPFFLFSANLATPELGDLPFPQIPLTDVFTFFNNKSPGFDDVGFAATLYGVPLSFKYNNPDRLYAFPMNFGDVDSSLSGFQFGIPDVGYIMVQKKRVNTVDGWGTLITPYGTFDVLRQKSVVDEYDSIYLDSLNAGVPVNRHYIEYKWLAKNGKEPLLQVNDDLMNFVVYYVDSVRNIPLAVPEGQVSDEFTVKIYPNPAVNRFWVWSKEFEVGEATIKLFDLNGKRIFEKHIPAGEENVNFNVSNLKSGVYLCVIETKKQLVMKKLIIKK